MKKWIVPCLLLLIYISSALLKVHLYTTRPDFDRTSDFGRYWYENAFHFRYAQMFAQKKSIPRIDTDIQYPEGLAIKKFAPLLMEFTAAQTYKIVHRFFSKITFDQYAIYFICFFSSLSIIFVFLLAQLLFSSSISGLLSALFFAFAIPAFDRLLGNFLQEDFALPILIAFLYYFTASLKYRASVMAITASFLSMLALYSWHFSQFVMLIFTVSVFLITLINPQERGIIIKYFCIVWLSFIIAFLLNPVLQQNQWIISYPCLIGCAVCLAYVISKKFSLSYNLIVCCVIIALLGIKTLFQHGENVYQHVYLYFLYKLKFFLIKPADPALLPPMVRSYWVEAFLSPSINYFCKTFIPAFLLFIVVAWHRKKQLFKFPESLITVLLIIFCFLFILTQRMSIFFNLFVCIFIGSLIMVHKHRPLIYIVLALCFLFQVSLAAHFNKPKGMYLTFIDHVFPTKPLHMQTWVPDSQDVLSWLKYSIPKKSVILAPIGISPTIALYSQQSVVLHPKFENTTIKEKSIEYTDAIYNNEKTFFDFVQKVKADYIVYQADFCLETGPDSYRYMTDNLKLSKESTVFKFHCAPELLFHFTLVHQNGFYRVYAVNKTTEKSRISNTYEPMFDISLYQTTDNEFFNDNVTESVLKRINVSIAQYQTGAQLFEQREYAKALSYFLEASAFNPNLIGLGTGIAICLAMKGDMTNALLNSLKEVEAHPTLALAYYNTAYIYAQTGNTEEAKKYVRIALNLNPRMQMARLLFRQIQEKEK